MAVQAPPMSRRGVTVVGRQALRPVARGVQKPEVRIETSRREF